MPIGLLPHYWGASFAIPQHPIICYTMPIRLAIVASILMSALSLNAQTIQGKVVDVVDGDTITILDEARAKKIGLWIDANPIPH